MHYPYFENFDRLGIEKTKVHVAIQQSKRVIAAVRGGPLLVTAINNRAWI